MRLKAAQSQAFHMTARQRHLLSRGTWPRANEVTLLTAISRRPDPETRLKQRYERNDAGVACKRKQSKTLNRIVVGRLGTVLAVDNGVTAGDGT
ncbi:hypothetical protein BHM03_00055765 [Ensete ventricosum]|nr:hypothetical protein BHM03_00055765 [Ensete ventricosum]